MSYKYLRHRLNDFEEVLIEARLSTDEIADLMDKLMKLEELLSEMESYDE